MSSQAAVQGNTQKIRMAMWLTWRALLLLSHSPSLNTMLYVAPHLYMDPIPQVRSH